MTDDLFSNDPQAPQALPLGRHATLLRGVALTAVPALLEGVDRAAAAAPWRHMETPGGRRMGVATTNAGALGWVSDRRGYRYQATDPLSGAAWSPLPAAFAALATAAAAEAGLGGGFVPDACLINRYTPGIRLSLHQDRDEQDLGAPIVSVSLGLPATFLWGGHARGDAVQRVPLAHGDVVVWGGEDRLRFHGVAPVAEGTHALTGPCRINLTFRKAG